MRAFFPSGTLGGAEIIGGVQRQKHLEQQLLLPHLHVAVINARRMVQRSFNAPTVTVCARVLHCVAPCRSAELCCAVSRC